jgi:HlyD family secretion protein
VRERECQAADAAVQLRKTELEAAQRRLARTEMLTSQGALSQRDIDDERATTRHAEAAVSASEVHLDAICAAVAAARMHVTVVSGQHDECSARSGVVWMKVDPHAEWPAVLSISPQLITAG